ncbi:MAG: hypothetical protein RLZZ293_947 [Pseudomonadota bacterium]|jgi:NAD+ kinase
MKKITNIIIIGRNNSEHLLPHIIQLAKWLEDHQFKVYLDQNSSSEIAKLEFSSGVIEQLIPKIDLAIIIGGDGTLLSAGRQLVSYDIPLIGINQGKLGFMTDIAINDMLSAIEDILLKHNYHEEQRTLLSAQVFRNQQKINHSLALNDIVISRGATGSMIEFEMSINHQFVHSQKSDGVIFATPTGSTAYSLAAGGAILHPHSKVFSIVPICPQSMSNRPIVISEDDIIELKLIKDNTTILHYDGQDYLNLQIGDQIIIQKFNQQLRLFHPDNYNYYNTLRNKLHWAKRVS